MKNLTLILGFVVALMVNETASAGPRRPIQRTQARQAARIAEGVQSGELNGPETRRLMMQQARIAHMRKEAAADGQVTAGEAARIRHKQRQANRRIYRQKHDGQQRGELKSNLQGNSEVTPPVVEPQPGEPIQE
ncbi:MAG: hypothetical protein IT288_10980 [Bdellovibrionales bacterium]|nr:hypothetical protein [Bdellovibrionales bacterium]